MHLFATGQCVICLLCNTLCLIPSLNTLGMGPEGSVTISQVKNGRWYWKKNKFIPRTIQQYELIVQSSSFLVAYALNLYLTECMLSLPSIFPFTKCSAKINIIAVQDVSNSITPTLCFRSWTFRVWQHTRHVPLHRYLQQMLCYQRVQHLFVVCSPRHLHQLFNLPHNVEDIPRPLHHWSHYTWRFVARSTLEFLQPNPVRQKYFLALRICTADSW